MPSAVPYLNLEDDSDIVSSDIYHFVSIPTHPFQLFWFSTFKKQKKTVTGTKNRMHTHKVGVTTHTLSKLKLMSAWLETFVVSLKAVALISVLPNEIERVENSPSAQGPLTSPIRV